jgi:leader peptidase (prepilin peptidase)/N-methyltransferase
MTPLWLVLGVGFVGGLVGLAAGLLSRNVLSNPRQLPFAVRGAMAASTAILFGLVTWLFGASWELPAFCVFAAVAVVLGAVDLVERRLPNAVLYPGLIVMVVLLASTSWITGTWAAFLGALCCGAGLFALYFLLAVISPSGIGMGDVKLAALVGLALGYLGWMPLLVGGTAGFFIGGLTSLIALVSGRASRRSSLPFGPAMLAGAFLGMLVA